MRVFASKHYKGGTTTRQTVTFELRTCGKAKTFRALVITEVGQTPKQILEEHSPIPIWNVNIIEEAKQ